MAAHFTHVTFTVSNFERSIDFYRDVCELDALEEPAAILPDPALGGRTGGEESGGVGWQRSGQGVTNRRLSEANS